MSGEVSRALIAFGRRDGLALFVRALLVTTPLGGAALVAAVRYGFPAVAAAAVVLAAALGGAAVAAFVQRRSPRELAAHIDRRQRFQNRVAAALEVENSMEAVAGLLRRDALARLATVPPAAALPIETPARLVHVLVVSVLIALVAFSIGSPQAAMPQPEARRTGPGDTTGAAADRASSPGEKDPETGNSAATSAATATPVAGQTAPATSAAAADTKAGGASAPGSAQASGDGTSRGAPGQLSTGARAAGAARPGAAAGGASKEGPAARRAGGISRDGEALPGSRVETPLRTPRAGTRLLASGGAGASSSALAGDGDLPPALRAYVLRYLESLKR